MKVVKNKEPKSFLLNTYSYFQANIKILNATGVPIPSKNVIPDRNSAFLGRELKICLYYNLKEKFFGNSVRVPGLWSENYEDR